MLIPTLYLIIAGQFALIMVLLIAYLIYTLVAEENRWEDYSKKLKSKITELLEYKDRFDIVSGNLDKQIEITKELGEKIEGFDDQLSAKDNKISELEFSIIDIESTKDSKISEQELLILELQSTISESKNSTKDFDENSEPSDASSQSVKELKTQLVLLEDQNTELSKQINGFNITIDTLESENKSLQAELSTAKERVSNNDLSADKATLGSAGSTQTSKGDDTSNLQQMLAAANEDVKELEGEINILQGEISQLLQENQVLSSAMENTSDLDSNIEVDIDSIDDIIFDVAKKS